MSPQWVSHGRGQPDLWLWSGRAQCPSHTLGHGGEPTTEVQLVRACAGPGTTPLPWEQLSRLDAGVSHWLGFLVPGPGRGGLRRAAPGAGLCAAGPAPLARGCCGRRWACRASCGSVGAAGCRAGAAGVGREGPLPSHPPVRPRCPCSPSLQLFDAHHEVEVALGVLLDDVPHVVGFPRLLRATKTVTPCAATVSPALPACRGPLGT